MTTIGRFSDVVYCTEAPDGQSARILLPPERTRQYPCLHRPVAIARYLASKSGGIDREL
jgi:hypothetical protein